MKMFSKIFTVVSLAFLTLQANAQKLKTTNGNPDILKTESSLNIEFTYDNISVGKFPKEADYIAKKTADYNAKEPGRGDIWAKNWISDRANRYEPKFIDLFIINSHMQISKTAKYTLIFKVRSLEPGYNIGGGFGMYGGRKDAELDADVDIVETDNRSKVVCSITINNAPGGQWGGSDYDTGTRISEAFAISGKRLGKYLK